MGRGRGGRPRGHGAAVSRRRGGRELCEAFPEQDIKAKCRCFVVKETRAPAWVLRLYL